MRGGGGSNRRLQVSRPSTTTHTATQHQSIITLLSNDMNLGYLLMNILLYCILYLIIINFMVDRTNVEVCAKAMNEKL